MSTNPAKQYTNVKDGQKDGRHAHGIRATFVLAYRAKKESFNTRAKNVMRNVNNQSSIRAR